MTTIRETYRGNKIVIRKGKQWGTVETLINGQSLGAYTGTPGSHLVSAHGTIDNFNERPEAYTNGNGEVTCGMVVGA